MKLKALIFLSVFVFAMSSAFSQVIPARVNVIVLSGRITTHIMNPFLRPIICSGEVLGQTISGIVLRTAFVNQVIFPGTDRIVFVQAHPANPFVSGHSNVYCQFTY